MKILFIDSTHPLLKSLLEKNGFICDEKYSLSKKQIEIEISKYEGVILRSKFKIDSSFIDKAKKLKFICRAGSGLENIDIKYAKSKGIKCYNAKSGNKQAVAEHALAMILSLFNNLLIANEEVRKGIWNREKNRGIELAGKTVAIIGYGNNGSAFAELLKGFNVKILAYDKYLKRYPFKSTMHKIYQEADILSLHIPLNSETTHLVNKKFIENFKKNIYLINTSRGKCINTTELVDCLKNKKILGACLDVLEYENTSFEMLSDTKDNKEMQYILENKKVILSPHIAGWTYESNIKIAEILFKKIISDFKN